jgi:RNA polymerase sigma factor (sigma-70 family)
MGEGTLVRAPDLAALYLEHREALLRAAKHQLAKFSALHRAEDAVHDVFAHLMETPPEHKVENWAVYLSSAVRNRAVDIGLQEAGHDRRGDNAIAVYVDVDEVKTFEAEFDRGRAANLMNRALAELPENERLLVLALYRDGRKNKDMAEELGVTAGRISQLHKQALQNFRQAYEALGGQR